MSDVSSTGLHILAYAWRLSNVINVQLAYDWRLASVYPAHWQRFEKVYIYVLLHFLCLFETNHFSYLHLANSKLQFRLDLSVKWKVQFIILGGDGQRPFKITYHFMYYKSMKINTIKFK